MVFWSVGRAPWSIRAPGGFGVWGGGPPRGPWSKGPLVVLEAKARPLLKKGPWWFWSVGCGVLQEAPCQKGPLVVLERRARGPPRGPWSKRAPGGFGV